MHAEFENTQQILPLKTKTSQFIRSPADALISSSAPHLITSDMGPFRRSEIFARTLRKKRKKRRDPRVKYCSDFSPNNLTYRRSK